MSATEPRQQAVVTLVPNRVGRGRPRHVVYDPDMADRLEAIRVRLADALTVQSDTRALVLQAVERGWPQARIAEALDVPTRTVESIIQRRKLRGRHGEGKAA